MAIASVSKTINPDDNPVEQEEEHVHTVYNEIAAHFSKTRYKPWPIVENFLNTRKDYSIGIDVGCGNGKYLAVNKKLFMIGTDRSDGLIDCAKLVSDDAYNVGVADGLHLPHADNKFDFAISIAVIHHFTTDERRIQAIQHIVSKLAPNGEALIYCWALEQQNSRRGYKEGDDQDILIPWMLPKSQKEPEADPEIKYRYYHLYRKGELADNCLKAGNCSIVEEGYEKDNWWIVIRKTS